MSASEREWDQSIVDAAGILVEREGVDGAISELNGRRQRQDETGRANEALAWIKRFVIGEYS